MSDRSDPPKPKAEPTTAAGKALVEWASRAMPAAQQQIWLDHALAIEDEARQPSHSRLRESAVQEKDSEALRTALSALVGMVEENGPDYADADAMQDARAALAALPSNVSEPPSDPPALDVERLAKAERLADPYGDNNSPADKRRRRSHSEKVAAEYDRLSAQPEAQPAEDADGPTG